MAEEYSIHVGIHYILFSRVSVDRPLAGFHFLSTMNNVAMHIIIQVSVQVLAFNSFWHMPRPGIPEKVTWKQYVYLVEELLVFQSGCTVLSSHQQ